MTIRDGSTPEAFNNTEQNDSHEFILFILNTLESEVNINQIKKGRSIFINSILKFI